MLLRKRIVAWGSNCVTELEQGVENCDIIVVVLSPEYLLSEWFTIENDSARIDNPATQVEPGDPTIATSQSSLALMLQALGILELDLAKQAYQFFLNSFGPDYPNTLICKQNWGSILTTSPPL